MGEKQCFGDSYVGIVTIPHFHSCGGTGPDCWFRPISLVWYSMSHVSYQRCSRLGSSGWLLIMPLRNATIRQIIPACLRKPHQRQHRHRRSDRLLLLPLPRYPKNTEHWQIKLFPLPRENGRNLIGPRDTEYGNRKSTPNPCPKQKRSHVLTQSNTHHKISWYLIMW